MEIQSMSETTMNIEANGSNSKPSLKNIFINPFDIVGFEEKEQDGVITKTFMIKYDGMVRLTLDTVSSTFSMDSKNVLTQSSETGKNEVEVKIYANHQ